MEIYRKIVYNLNSGIFFTSVYVIFSLFYLHENQKWKIEFNLVNVIIPRHTNIRRNLHKYFPYCGVVHMPSDQFYVSLFYIVLYSWCHPQSHTSINSYLFLNHSFIRLFIHNIGRQVSSAWIIVLSFICDAGADGYSLHKQQ